MEITVQNLKERLLDLTHPFGHGFVVGMALASISPDDLLASESNSSSNSSNSNNNSITKQ